LTQKILRKARFTRALRGREPGWKLWKGNRRDLRIIAKLGPREIEGADRVLDGAVYVLNSGNLCRVWPAMSRVAGKEQTRIAFYSEWQNPPTPEDSREFMELCNYWMGRDPEVMIESEAPADVKRASSEWLKSGAKPQAKRTN
jgi:hypothetical protein